MNIKLKLFFYLILISASGLSFADDTDGDGIDDSIDNCVSVEGNPTEFYTELYLNQNDTPRRPKDICESP